MRASPAGGPRASDWAALGRELPPGALLRPGDQGYPAARRLFDPRFDGLRPAGVASCGSAANVASCISFARRFGLPIAARSGGHSYAGWSSTTGLMVDVGPMQSFRVDGSRVTVGAGLRLIDFYTQLAARGLAVPGGSCPTVGIAGLTLGGGVGVLGRQYGLTCDNLVGLEMVTADGRIRQVDAGHDPDLLWASQGGGGGNFGIATSFTFTARPLASLTQFFLSWPWSQAARVVGGWQGWAPHLSDQWWANLHLAAAPGAAVPLSVQVGGTFLGSPADAGGELSRLFAAVGSDPSSGEPFESPYLHAMLIEAGCSDLTTDQCHLPGSQPGHRPGGQLAREPELAKSDFFTRPLPALRADGAASWRGAVSGCTPRGGRVRRYRAGRVRRGHQQARSWGHRVRAPGRAVPGAVHDDLGNRGGGRRRRPAAGLAAVLVSGRCGPTPAGRRTRTTSTRRWRTGGRRTTAPTTRGWRGSRRRTTPAACSGSRRRSHRASAPGDKPGPAAGVALSWVNAPVGGISGKVPAGSGTAARGRLTVILTQGRARADGAPGGWQDGRGSTAGKGERA